MSFCSKPQIHQKSKYMFCSDCANKGIGKKSSKPIEEIFYCEQCKKNMRMRKHESHNKKLFSLTSNTFREDYSNFKAKLRDHIQDLYYDHNLSESINEQNVDRLIDKLDQNYRKLFVEKQLEFVINDKDFREWLVKKGFWKDLQNSDSLKETKLQVKESILRKGNDTQKIDTSPKESKSDTIEDKMLDEAILDALAQTDELMANQQNSIRIINFFLKLYSTFEAKEAQNLLQGQCQNLLQLYPCQKMLYLGKLRLLELIPGKNKTIQNTLQKILKIDPSFTNNYLYHFYQATSKWQVVNDQIKSQYQASNDPSIKFFRNLKNRHYYALKQPRTYIKHIKKAIQLNNKVPLLYAFLAIGHIVQGDNSKAEECFKKLEQDTILNQEPLKNNRIWCSIHQKEVSQETLSLQTFVQKIDVCSMHLIINLAKHFKKNKIYHQLVRCCETLCEREQKNIVLKEQLIKAMIRNQKYQQGDGCEEELDDMIKQFQKSRSPNINKLRKRFWKMKAADLWKRQKYQESNGIFEQITTKDCQKSSTDWYNLAASLFKANQDKNDEQSYKEALDAINKALSLKPSSKKYKKLQFFILCYLSEFSKASVLYSEVLLNEQLKQYQELKEHIFQNLNQA